MSNLNILVGGMSNGGAHSKIPQGLREGSDDRIPHQQPWERYPVTKRYGFLFGRNRPNGTGESCHIVS